MPTTFREFFKLEPEDLNALLATDDAALQAAASIASSPDNGAPNRVVDEIRPMLLGCVAEAFRRRAGYKPTGTVAAPKVDAVREPVRGAGVKRG